MMEMPRDMRVKSILQLTKETLCLANTRKLLFNHKAVYGNEVIALKAMHEWIFLFLFVPAILSAALNWEKIVVNPLTTRIGWYDACCVFDPTPERHVAAVLAMVAGHFGLTHVHWTLIRLWSAEEGHRLEMPRAAHWFVVVSNVWWAIAICAFILVFVIPPVDGPTVWWHAIWFINVIHARVGALCASYVEHAYSPKHLRTPLPYGATPFMILQVALIALPWLVMYSFHAYDAQCGSVPEGECTDYTPPIPFWLGQTLDALWFMSLPLTPLFLPVDKF